MKKFIVILPVTVLILLFVATSSCTKEPAPLKDYLIQVDSIHVADTVSAGVPFDIEFFGIIGFDMCHSFKVFNQVYKGNDITIQAWATYDNTAEACPDALVMLDGRKLSVNLSVPGYYNLMINEPTGYSIYKQILVR
ncbi:MAG TPA: hypothetical protein VJ963_06370 [Bacteroidales bacterium]|nr:hypothetical protein [Bacteroidales bacterium]